MCTKIYTGLCRILFLLLFYSGGLFGQNDALYLDGANDYITLNPIGNFAANSNFTIEAQFTTTPDNQACTGNFRRLFSLSGAGNSRFEFGSCGGDFVLFYNGNTSGLVTISTNAVNIEDDMWHCVSVVRNGGTVEVHLDGALIYTGATATVFNSTVFRVGHWGGGITATQDWLGRVDEVKLWGIALPATNLTACSPCVLKGTETGLVVYWPLDDGVANSNNTSLTQVADDTPIGNNGILSSPSLVPPGFTLNNTTTGLSNFTTSTAPLIYPHYKNVAMLLSKPTQPPIVPVSSICEGDPVHFSLIDPTGNPVFANGNASVVWQYSDDNFANTTTIPPGGGSSALFSGFSFVSTPNHPALLCNNAPAGFVDRRYRATITVTQGGNSCVYTINSVPLHICCKIKQVQVNVTPMGPLCQGDMVQFTASVSSNMPAPATGNNVHIQWCVVINGAVTPLTGTQYDDKTTITYPSTGALTLNPSSICFEAKISNCSCPSVAVRKCVRIDPKPSCGNITGSATPSTLMPDPDGNPDHYVICPGNDAAIEMVNPAQFQNCNPRWEYMFPNTQAGVWHPMGSSNSQQNTNILPHINPNVSPFAWPPGETCIVYRIQCVPLNTPSGCQPCFSNEVRVCLKTPPTPPIIAASPLQICKGGIANLTVQNPDPNCNYEWYNNGLLVGFGTFLNTQQGGCYTVTCFDNCFTVVSNKVCVDVCESVAIISCQIPVCPCIGDKITIDGLNSFSTCGHPLTYTWTWVDSNGALQTFVGATLMDIPAAAGTTYSLTVTDTVLGCTDTTQYTIVPCAP